MKNPFANMSPRLRILLAAAVLVFGAGLLARLDYSSLPIPGTVGRVEAEVKKFRRELATARMDEQEQQARVAKIRGQAETFWRNTGNPHAEIAGELDKVARRANIILQNVGGPGESKISDHVTGTEISVQFMGSMHEIARFFAALEANRPRFCWRSFNLSPDNPKDPKKVSLSGRLMLVTLSPDASKLIEPKTGSP